MKIILILCLFIGSLYISFAQAQIRGAVTDIHGKPVPGATIKGNDGNTLAFADSLGRFTLQEPFPSSITVSHVSYRDTEAEISLTHTGMLAVILDEKETLIKEVEISTGFQRIPKERATGAFSHIDNETFNEQVSSDVLSRLEAVANGLNISRTTTLGGSDMGIRIRGLSTLSTGSIRDPLIILDNFPYEGNLDNINPNDVENITLLKDAAAASIWGARAGNGVIVITTKRGSHNQPLRVDFNSNVSVGGKPNLRYHQLMSSKEYIEVERFLFANEHRFSDTAAVARPAFSPVYEILFNSRNGDISNSEASALLDELAQVDVRDQYLRYMYEPSVNHQYAISLQGGIDNIAWYLSTGYDRNKSTLGAIDNRYNINFRNTYIPFKSLQLQVGLMYTQSRFKNGRSGYMREEMPPYTLLADLGGNAMRITRNYRQPFLDTLGGGKLLDWNYYPLIEDQHIHDRTFLNHTLLNFGINQTVLEWLAVDMKYQYGRQQVRNNLLREEESYFARSLINQFSQILPATGQITHNVPAGSIMDMKRIYLQSHNLRAQLNLNHSWESHDVAVLVGAEASHRNSTSNANRTYGYNPEILTAGQVDYINRFRHIITGSNSLIPQNHDFDDQTQRFISIFGNAGYTFAKRYTLTLSGRRDASNQFGINFNDRWNLLWSAGFSWDVSEESFYRFDLIPYVRIRATYGFSGNTDLNRSGVTTIMYQSTSPYINSPMAIISQNGNPELGWEKVRMVNFAVDFKSKSERLSGSLDYFIKVGTDLFGPDPIGYTTGLSGTVTRNLSSLSGRGIDIELNSVNIDRQFQWKSNLNFSFYTDRVTRYYRPSNSNPSSRVVISGYSFPVEGERLYSLYSYRWGGLDPRTGDPIGYIGGEPSKNYSSIIGAGTQLHDLVNHGSSIPLFYGSIGNSFEYGGVGLTLRFLYKLGYYFRNPGVSYASMSSIVGHSEYSNRWKQEGDELRTDVPSMVYPYPSGRDNFYNHSEIRVLRGDHIRLQYLSLYYDLSGDKITWAPMRSLRFYFNASNLGIAWKASEGGVDPEYGADVLPPAPVYSFGVRFNL